MELSRRDGRHDSDLAAAGGIGFPRPQRFLERSVPHEHERSARHLRDRLDQLLDPTPRRQTAVVEHDLLGRVQPEVLVEACSRGDGGV